jgi:hypothetical protein
MSVARMAALVLGAPLRAMLLHFAPPALTCCFIAEMGSGLKFRLVPVEGGGVEWSAVE